MRGLIKKTFIEVLIGIVNGSNQTKCMSLSNQKCMNRPTLINLYHTVKNFTGIHLWLFKEVCM